MHLVIVESPYAAETPEGIELHVRYARACLRDCLDRGEAPWASHLVYTQPGVLRDEVPSERTRGIEAGLAWGARADATVVYVDLGLSSGMRYGIEHAVANARPIDIRTLPTRALHEAIGYRATACRSTSQSATIDDVRAVIAAAEARR